KRKPVAGRLIAQGRLDAWFIDGKPAAIRLQEVPCPMRTRERPFALGAQQEFFTGVTDVERHARPLLPAGVFALEEMAEEALLQLLAVAAVEMREVGVAVHLQPFLLGAGAQPAFKIAARV